MLDSNLAVSAATELLCTSYTKNPSHAVMLDGEQGSGLTSLATWMGEQLADSASLVTIMEPEKNLIAIERIRGLYEQTKSIQQGRRVIILDEAHTMSQDAQNAFLKLLEEPANNVHFILTTHHVGKMLPTILSRVQRITVQPISKQQSLQLLDLYELNDTQRMQALFLASGRPAELVRLASDAEYLASRGQLVTDARTFLQTDTYSRLGIIKKYTDRTAALELLAACGALLDFMIHKQKAYAAAETIDTIDTISKRIVANGHVRTQLLYLVTKLS